MTNKELSKHISIGYEPIGVAEDAAYEMALWKDNHVKKYLNEKIERYVKEANTLPWYHIIRHIKLEREIFTLFMVLNDLFEDE